jgi:hypothetical protein
MDKLPWYRRKYGPRKSHVMMQVGFGFSVLLVFVVIPTWIDYTQVHNNQRWLSGGKKINHGIQEAVLQHRLELRRKISEEEE